MPRRLLTYLILSFTLTQCSTPENVDLLINNASVVDVISGSVSQNKMIAISDGQIVAVEDASKITSYYAPEVINAEGKFVMPGLWDNHVHFRGGEELIFQNKDFLPLFLAHGVTAIRDAGGDITPAVQEWQRNIETGELDGPFIFTSGPKLDGSKPAWDGSISVIDKESASSALDSLESINADYVKMYDGNLTKESFYDIIQEAEARGLKTTGHMPLSADLLEAVDLGLDGTEHLYYVLKAISSRSDSLTEAGLGYGMITPLIDTYDEALAQEVYKKLADAEFYVTPTLHVGKTLAEILIVDHSEDLMLKYIPLEIKDSYQRRINSAKRGGESYTATRAKWANQFQSMVKPMFEAGINILAGSDCGPFNSFTYPGESIHEELRLFVEEAGLTPQEALVTSIIYGPKFVGLEESYGSVEKGKVADLLILDGNPLKDINQTRAINSVITKGKSYSRLELGLLMSSVEQKN